MVFNKKHNLIRLPETCKMSDKIGEMFKFGNELFDDIPYVKF